MKGSICIIFMAAGTSGLVSPLPRAPLRKGIVARGIFDEIKTGKELSSTL